MSDETGNRTSATKALEQALEELLPVSDADLDDERICGPRGGMRGWRRAEGAWRPGVVLLTRAVCDRDHCNENIEHGHSYFWEHGEPGHYGSTTFTGPTFRDTVEVRATLEVIAGLARSNKGQAIDLDQARGLIAAAVLEHEQAACAEAGVAAPQSANN